MPRPAMRLELSAPDLKPLARGLNNASQNVPKILDAGLREIGREIVKAMKAEAPKQTGALRKSHQARILKASRRQSRLVIASAPHGRYVREGTKPHVIRPVSASVLTFYWPKVGKRVFLASVNHPGTKPNKYHRRAWKKVRPKVRRILSRLQRQVGSQVLARRISVGMR